MTVFEELALIYDQSIDWTPRLQRELPFLYTLIENRKPARILDLACGSGRHAVALAQKGHEVIGLDLSPQMIAAATRHAEENDVNVQFHTADMSNAKSIVSRPFDLILCLGNSLSLLPSIDALRATLQSANSLLTKDGYLVTQTLNFEEMHNTQFRFFPLKSGTTTAGNEVIFARFFEPFSDTSTATMVFTGFIKTDTSWKTKTHTHQVLQITHPLMEELFKTTKFTRKHQFANYQKQQFDSENSRNLIILAQK
ncbi:MAG: class I SAM-dependent methyltransferase [Candidatus Hermodarchaeia archaeon]|jgi:2-polyprenyl-3-methyl-5-hydroxy-6-metoxy-1,4-benzoquinol methylase